MNTQEPTESGADAGSRPATPPTAAKAASPAAIVVDQYTRRSDADVLPGQFARIATGEHAGQIGVFETVVENGPDGYPAQVELILRNSGERVVCTYGDLTPVTFGGR
jgi:hypothetical protein